MRVNRVEELLNLTLGDETEIDDSPGHERGKNRKFRVFINLLADIVLQ